MIRSRRTALDMQLTDLAEVGAPHPGLQKCVELKTNGPIANARHEGIFHK